MKQYKLIKEFPGSIKAGEVVSKQRNSRYIHQDKNGDVRLFYRQEVEDYPEFWEEVKEKEYTILSFVSGVLQPTELYLLEGSKYRDPVNGSLYSLEEMLNGTSSVESSYLKIHSVRREKDGEVFQLGDKIVSTSKDFKELSVTIEEIEINKVALGGIYLIEKVEGIAINCAEKAPIRKPILVIIKII